MMKSKSYKKGQAALEFLTTYGWAFLVILVAIGGLSYFGVFDLGRVLPEGCKLDTNLACGDVYVLDSSNAEFNIQLKNNRDKVVNVISVSLYEKGIQEEAGAPPVCTSNANPNPTPVQPGKIADVAFDSLVNGANCGLDNALGDKKTFLIEVTYNVGSSGINVVSSGELTTTVQ